MDAWIAGIAAPLLPAGNLENVEWRFHILREPMVNAFALPNGSIYLDTGLMARAENDSQLAGVLAQQIAHVTDRHAYRFNRSMRKKTVASNAMVAIGSWLPFGGALGASVAAARGISQMAILISVCGYSRDLEREADMKAVEALKTSGRNPAQLVRMLEILDEKLEPVPIPFFFHDHPKLKERIEYLKTKQGLRATPPAVSDPGYIDRTRPVLLQNIQLDLDSRRFRSAVAGAERLVAAHSGDAEALFWLGEAYRSVGPRHPRLTKEELSDWSQRSAYRKEHNRTEEEQAKKLASSSEGRETLRANQSKARELFEKAAAADPAQPKPYLGLGMLCQAEGKPGEALIAFHRYLQISPDGPDRARVERRIEVLAAEGVGK